MFFVLTAILTAGTAPALLPDQDSLLAGLQRSLEARQERLKREYYSFVTTAVIRELDKDGSIKRTDTVATWQLQRGDSLLRDSTIYTTRKPEKGKKREGRRESASLPKLGDTSYVYEKRGGDSFDFRPRRPRKGDLAGSFGYDPESLTLTWAELRMPRPKAPVKEFAMRIDWMAWEGMMVPERMWMRAAWSLLVMSGRMEMEIGFSDYRLHR